ncbi:hypothetical protein GYH30_025851 [Glycine max]|nr:hypothetical protein GYH30_025851 [Glycine max]
MLFSTLFLSCLNFFCFLTIVRHGMIYQNTCENEDRFLFFHRNCLATNMVIDSMGLMS